MICKYITLRIYFSMLNSKTSNFLNREDWDVLHANAQVVKRWREAHEPRYGGMHGGLQVITNLMEKRA